MRYSKHKFSYCEQSSVWNSIKCLNHRDVQWVEPTLHITHCFSISGTYLTFIDYRSLRSFWMFHNVSALFFSWATSSSFSFWLMTLVNPELLRTAGRLKKTSLSMPYMPCHKKRDYSDINTSPQICLGSTAQDYHFATCRNFQSQRVWENTIVQSWFRPQDQQYQDGWFQKPPPPKPSLLSASSWQNSNNIRAGLFPNIEGAASSACSESLLHQRLYGTVH